MGNDLEKIPRGDPLDVKLAITQDWFTVFHANAAHLGRSVTKSAINKFLYQAAREGRVRSVPVPKRSAPGWLLAD